MEVVRWNKMRVLRGSKHLEIGVEEDAGTCRVSGNLLIQVLRHVIVMQFGGPKRVLIDDERCKNNTENDSAWLRRE